MPKTCTRNKNNINLQINMRKLLYIAVLAFGMSVTAQTKFFSEYNRGKISKETFGEWFVSDSNTEMKIYKLSPVDYKKAVDELILILKFYNKDINSPDNNKSIFYDNETIFDYQKVYINSSIKFTEISMGWRVNNLAISLLVRDDGSAISIFKLK